MDNKKWKKERMGNMKKLHKLMLAAEDRRIFPRDLTEAMTWFVSEEFVSIQDTKRFALFDEDYYVVAGNVYRHEFSSFVKMEVSGKEMKLINKLIQGG